MFSKKIARHEDGELLVSTVLASDTGKYETAVQHPLYGDRFHIVEQYKTEELAKEGHDKWVGIMTADVLPKSLTDRLVGPFGFLSAIFSGRTEKTSFRKDLKPMSDN